MNSVFFNSKNETHSFMSFHDKFLAICAEHKQSDKALIFAFILYDFENPQISKILQDSDYWLNLDKLSGNYLTIFSFHYKPKVRYKGTWRDMLDDFMGSTQVVGLMTTSFTFQNPSEDTNLLIEKYFGNNIEVKYPSVLFFQILDYKILDYVLVELDEQKLEESFLELKIYIQTAVDTLKQITTENRGNSKEIFELVESNVKSVRSRIVTSKRAKKLTSITELASSIIGLSS